MKIFYAAILILSSLQLPGQSHTLILHKKKKILLSYSPGSYIAFMDDNRQWQYGIISKIRNDSFYIRAYSVQYNFTSIDTIRYEIVPFSIGDVFAMPKQGVQIDDGIGPRNHQIVMDAGHQHFWWVKSGWIFRVVAIGYTGLNLVNALVVQNQPVAWAGLAIAAGVFAFGEFLKWNYRPYLKLGKKYFLKTY